MWEGEYPGEQGTGNWGAVWGGLKKPKQAFLETKPDVSGYYLLREQIQCGTNCFLNEFLALLNNLKDRVN